ncbi:MAG: hypothetical protein RR137_08925 [Odoribacter sp.]
MGYLTDVAVVEALSGTDKLVVNAGNKVRQITFNNLNKSIDVLNEKELMQVAFYTDFDEDGQTILKQGGNLAIVDYIYSRGGNYIMNNTGYCAKLNASDPTKFIDGTPAPLDGTNGHEMTMLPDYYYLVETRPNGKPRYWVSLKDIGGKYQPAQWMGTHKGYMDGTRLVSRSGVVPSGGLTLSAFTTAARVNGADWGLANYTMRKTLALMFFSKYNTTLSQGGSIVGNGMSGIGSTYSDCRNIPTGKANSLGDGTGYVDVMDAAGNRVGSVSVFGVKDPFGQIWEHVGGIICVGNKFYISDVNTDPIDGVPNWQGMRICDRLETGSGSFITNMQWGEHADMLAKAVGGSSTTYYTDGYWYSTSGRVVFWGGGAYDGALCGLVCAVSDYVFSYAYASFGARLGFYGSEKIVSGSKLISM